MVAAKKKPATLADAVGAEIASVIAAQVDELGALEKKLLPFKAEIARVETLRKAIRSHFDASPANEGFQPSGDNFFCAVGPRGFENVINAPKLIKVIGLKTYARLAKITLKALDEGVSRTIAAAVVTLEQTSHRTLKTFEVIK